MVEFSFGMPVKKEYFYNRKEELHNLLNRIEKIKKGVRNDVAIIGPRRVGKSSLTNKLAEELRKMGLIPIQVDCEGLTLPVFLKEFSNAIIEEEMTTRGLVKKFRETVNQGLSSSIAILSEALGRVKAIELKSPLIDFLALRIDIEKTPESELNREKLYDFFSRVIELPEKVGKKYVVVLDEFQETATYGILKKNDFHALFRRIVQNHRNVCYIYTGSSIGMMDDIFGNPTNPLAGNADILQLGPFDRKTSIEFVKKGLINENKIIEENSLVHIFEQTGGFPAYLNWIGLKLLEERENVISKEKVNELLLEMLSPASAIYQSISKQLVRLGSKTKRILAMISLGNHEPPKIQREAGTKNVYVYLNRLQNYGLIKKDKNKFDIIDPVIKEGLRRNIF